MKVTLVYDVDDNDDNIKTLRGIIHHPTSSEEINYAIHKLVDTGSVKAMVEGDYIELYKKNKEKLDSVRYMLI